MGDPKRQKKKYRKPRQIWDSRRIESEKKILEKYGLKNKQEIWKAESAVKRLRTQAKKLLTAELEEQEKFLNKLTKLGLIKEKTISHVLELQLENILNRRLQTIATQKFSLRPKQARQAITHGHIMVQGKKVNIPSFFVDIKTEKDIQFKK